MSDPVRTRVRECSGVVRARAGKAKNIVKIARDFLDNSSFLGYNNQLMGGNVDCLQVEMRRVES